MWVGCFNDGVVLYVGIMAWEWDVSCMLVAVYIQPFWCHHYMILLCLLVAFHMLKDKNYWLQLENLLLYVSVYWAIITDGILRYRYRVVP